MYGCKPEGQQRRPFEMGQEKKNMEQQWQFANQVLQQDIVPKFQYTREPKQNVPNEVERDMKSEPKRDNFNSNGTEKIRNFSFSDQKFH